MHSLRVGKGWSFIYTLMPFHGPTHAAYGYRHAPHVHRMCATHGLDKRLGSNRLPAQLSTVPSRVGSKYGSDPGRQLGSS